MSDTQRLKQSLGQLAKGLADLTPVMAQIAKETRTRMKHTFWTEGASDGQAWAPLSIDYARRKAGVVPPGKKRRVKGSVKNKQVFPGKTILRRTDKLYKSLTQAKAEGSISIIGKQRFTYGTSIEYAQYHQTGARRGSWRLPKRPIFRKQTNANEVKGFFDAHIQRELKRLGLIDRGQALGSKLQILVGED